MENSSENQGVERWAAVDGLDGWYEVSDLGRVRRTARGFSTKPGRVLSGNSIGRPGPSRYRQYDLRTGKGNRDCRLGHRMVMQAFGPPQPGPHFTINHINGIKDDNRLGNLEWVTPGDNMAHAYSTGLHPRLSGERNPWAKLSSAQVEEIRAIGRSKKLREIGALYGISITTVSRIIRGTVRRAG